MRIPGTISGGLLIALFFLLGGGMTLLTGGAVEQSSLARMLWLLIYGSAAAYGFHVSKSLWSTVCASPGFMLLALLCLCSILWSSARSTTLSYSVAIFGATLVTYLMLTKVEPFRLLQYSATALLLLILINGALMLPNLPQHLGGAGRYSGIFTQPNVLGRVASLGVVLLILLLLSGEYSRPWGYLGVAVGSLLVIACNSMTSIVSVLLALSVFLLRRVIGRPLGGGQILLFAWFCLCVGGLMCLNSEAIIRFCFETMGRSPNLTGRTELWAGIREAISLKPYLGYGYCGFWAGERVLSAQILSNAGWKTASAHSGLFDVALHVGLLGVLLFGCVIGRALLSGFKSTFGSGSPLAPVLLALLSYLLMLGATESAYMMRNSINWSLMIICVHSLREISRAQRSAALETKRIERHRDML